MSILKDIEHLVEAGLITEEQAVAIRQYYQNNTGPKYNTLMLIFASIGALLIGMAIILIIAHNWDQMSRTARLILAFTPLVISQLLALYTLVKKPESQVWREATSILLFFSIGACLALTAQIYNIEDIEGMFQIYWLILCIPIVYVMQSASVSLLSYMTLIYYSMANGSPHNNELAFVYFLVFFLSLIPFYIRLIQTQPSSNTTYIHHWFIALTLLPGTAQITHLVPEALTLTYFALFMLLYNLGKSRYFSALPTRVNAYYVLGLLGIIILLIAFSFEDVWFDFDRSKLLLSRESLLTLAYFIGAMVLYFLHQKFKIEDLLDMFLVFIPFAIIFLLIGEYQYILINIIVLTMGILYIRRGSTQGKLSVINLGLVMVSIIILSRFFDTDLSYLVKGLVFALLGIGFIVANYFIVKNLSRDEK